MNQVNRGNKREYIPPQLRVYKSLKDITAAETCFCDDVNCPVYCQFYAYPLTSVSTYCPGPWQW